MGAALSDAKRVLLCKERAARRRLKRASYTKVAAYLCPVCSERRSILYASRIARRVMCLPCVLRANPRMEAFEAPRRFGYTTAFDHYSGVDLLKKYL